MFKGCFFIFILAMLIVLSTDIMHAQDQDFMDNILWAQVHFKKSFSPQWIGFFKPILRRNNDLGSHQNFSLDYAIRRKLGKKAYIQFTGRTWWMPERGDRQFLWLEVGHKTVLPGRTIIMSNRLRYHLALNLYGNFDPDFLRHLIKFLPNTTWKLMPSFGVETFFQFNGFNQVRRIRFEPGITYHINTNMDYSLVLWRQNTYNTDISRHDNLWVSTISFKL